MKIIPPLNQADIQIKIYGIIYINGILKIFRVITVVMKTIKVVIHEFLKFFVFIRVSVSFVILGNELFQVCPILFIISLCFAGIQSKILLIRSIPKGIKSLVLPTYKELQILVLQPRVYSKGIISGAAVGPQILGKDVSNLLLVIVR